MKNLKITRVMDDGSVLSVRLSDIEMRKAYEMRQNDYRKEDAKDAMLDYMTELVDDYPILLRMPFMDHDREVPKKKIRKRIVKAMVAQFTDDASIPQRDEWFGIARDTVAKTCMPHILRYIWDTKAPADLTEFKRFLKQTVRKEDISTVFIKGKEYGIPETLKQKNFTDTLLIRPEDLSAMCVSKNDRKAPANDAQVLLHVLEHILLQYADTKLHPVLKFCGYGEYED